MYRTVILAWFAVLSAIPVDAQVTSNPIRIVSTFPGDTPIGTAVREFYARLTRRLGDQFPVSMVTPEGPITAALSEKRAEIGVLSTTNLRDLAPNLGLYDLPMLFQNISEVTAVQGSIAGLQPLIDLKKNGILSLGYLNNGFSTLLTKSKPEGAGTFRNKSIAVTSSSNGFTINQLGANAKYLTVGEATIGLKTGPLDGVVTSASDAENFYVSLSEGVFSAAIQFKPQVATIIIREELWKNLPYRVQAILTEEADVAEKQAAELAARQDSKSLSWVQSSSAIPISVARFSQTIRPVWNESGRVDQSLLNGTVLPTIERIRLQTDTQPPTPQRDRRGANEPAPIKDASIIGPRSLQPGELLFATDRAFEVAPEPEYQVGPRRGALSFGIAKLPIQSNQPMGVVSSAPLAAINKMDSAQFSAQLRAALALAPKKEVVVFIHGFYTSFPDAARALALLNADVHFGGVPVLFSWPSQGRWEMYPTDADEVKVSRDEFLTFLDIVKKQSGAARVHVAAYSMGNRLVLYAIDRYDALQRGNGDKLFDHTVMAAPDIFVGEFTRGAADAFLRRSQRTTLYASERDAALACSNWIHSNQRLGQGGSMIFVGPPLESIDVTEAIPVPPLTSVDRWDPRPCRKGHDYLMTALRVQADMQSLILQDLPPPLRHGLATKKKNGMDYWAFRPQP